MVSATSRRPTASSALLTAACGAVVGGFYGKEVGDSQNVWFRPGSGTAFFYGICFPVLFFGVPLTAGFLAALVDAESIGCELTAYIAVSLERPAHLVDQVVGCGHGRTFTRAA